VTIDKPTFNATTGLPPETILNSGVIASNETPNTPSNVVKTTVVQVLGVKAVRKPAILPFTGLGLPLPAALAFAAVLIAAGAALTATRRREKGELS